MIYAEKKHYLAKDETVILYSAPSSYYSMIARLSLLESGISFEIKYMDIHMKKDQLKPWYMAINPAMTVPALTDGVNAWTDSRMILSLAASKASPQWCDSNSTLSTQIEQIVSAHYAITIERLTFAKAMLSIPPLRHLFCKVLRNTILQLEKELPTSANPTATEMKMKLNQERLAYFNEGSLIDKLQAQKEDVNHYLNQLPHPNPGSLLFGDVPSSADIVTAVLFTRLKMIHEYALVVPYPHLQEWFHAMQSRPAFKAADMWLSFKPWRILFRY